MNQDVLDRLVSLERAEKVAAILFPDEVPPAVKPSEFDLGGRMCPICDEHRINPPMDWPSRVAQVRAAIQSTFPTPVEAIDPTGGNQP